MWLTPPTMRGERQIRRLLASIALTLTFAGFAHCRSAWAADADQELVSTSRKVATNAADFAGQDTCATCHANVAQKFGSNPHARLSLEHAGKGVTCESCHGPGKAHVEGGGDVTKIRRFDKLGTKEIDQTC